MISERHGQRSLNELSARDRLIVGLDNPDHNLSLQLVRDLGPAVTFYKVGWRAFLTGGMEMVNTIHGMGKRIFLDLKMNDIEATIESAVDAIKGKVQFLTIFGNAATAGAAARGRGDTEFPKLLTVSLLSSQDESDLINELGAGYSGTPAEMLEAYMKKRAASVLAAGCDGLIVSGSAIKLLRDTLGPEPLLVSPGIRMANEGTNEHKRSATPRDAMVMGSDYLVVARPVWAAADPIAAAEAYVGEIEKGLADRTSA